MDRKRKNRKTKTNVKLILVYKSKEIKMKVNIYKKRRALLAKKMPKGSALFLPSASLLFRNKDVHWPYRQNSNLFYFTGFKEPESGLIVLPNKGDFLFVRKKNAKQELWNGPMTSYEKAKELSQVDACYPTSEFLKIAEKVLKNIPTLYYTFGVSTKWDKQLNTLIAKRKKSRGFSVKKAENLITPLRMQKSEEEIKMIKKAVDISAKAHIAVIKHTRPGLNERTLYARFLFEIMKRGAEAEAYPGIFAGGKNACILHYIANNKILKQNELFLVDAGAEYNYYSADITRTFPISGRFLPLQKRIYKKLLKVQKQIIQSLKPGVSLKEIQTQCITLLSILLKEEKLLSPSLKEIMKKKLYKKYFPHSFGHLLGLDVHDSVLSDHPKLTLKENFVLTVEPGLYFPAEDSSIPSQLRGTGFRIEDDILITKKGREVLSKKAPKEVEELEELMKK